VGGDSMDRPAEMHSILEGRFACDLPHPIYSVQNGTEQYYSALYGIVLNSLFEFVQASFGVIRIIPASFVQAC